MPSELKPCPFCGGVAEICKYTVYGSSCGWFVYCYKCGAETKLFTRKDVAASFWNKRKGEENG